MKQKLKNREIWQDQRKYKDELEQVVKIQCSSQRRINDSLKFYNIATERHLKLNQILKEYFTANEK
jgi:hypothetical protein